MSIVLSENVKSFLKRNKMKKLLLLLFVLILSSFEIHIEPREAYASDRITSSYGGSVQVSTEVYQANGITYRVFYGNATAQSIDIEVINETKEKLEIEKLKLEIEKLKFESRNRR